MVLAQGQLPRETSPKRHDVKFVRVPRIEDCK